MDDDFSITRAKRRANLREIFKSTLDILSSNKRLIEETRGAKDAAIFYDADDCPTFKSEDFKTKITVTGERSFEAAKRLLEEKDGKVAVLNFANSMTPGGGVFGGSGAQEESLCRCSNLYPVIEQDKFRESYYDKNRFEDDFRATDAIIYARDITVFKSDTDYPELLPEKEWYKVDVITCAAPNIWCRRSSIDEYDYEDESDLDWQAQIHWHRTDHILHTALANGARRIVLGAFGCGAFGNNPKSVAEGMLKAINSLPNQFEEIVFAIYHQPYELQNYQAFKQVFEGKTEYDFKKFLVAHDEHYERALSEIEAGQKQTHWMWFIFPQLRGLGFSRMSNYYGIGDTEEAKAYLKNTTLKKHLVEISEALYKCDGKIIDIMGDPDYKKMLSCMTLFNAADPSIEVFQNIIDKFYSGTKDQRTLDMIGLTERKD